MFIINNRYWELKFVSPYSKYLQRSNGSYTLGMTDAEKQIIYLSNELTNGMLKKVLTHELCHAFCISYNIYLPIEYEEILCEAISIYGKSILDLANSIYNNLHKYYGEQL